ncbi:MAG TPA: STAS domain-containing protein [Solirubrobacteraceae bacterium]|jgi:anti-anti-sigma factor|nr:STAS domain-containing protein [Solirubrobacteraceae bacterium]
MSGAVTIERVDGVPVARVNKDIDAASAGAVREQLGEALGPDTHSLIVDLSETRYVDSGGLDMLLRLSDRLKHRRAMLILVIPEASQLNRLAAIVGLPQAMPVRPTLAAAQQAAAQLPTLESGTPLP